MIRQWSALRRGETSPSSEQQAGCSCNLRGVYSSPPTQDVQAEQSQFSTTAPQRCLETLRVTPLEKHLMKSCFSSHYDTRRAETGWSKTGL